MLVETINTVLAHHGDTRTLRLYGQEVNLTTSAIARMNLFLHDIEDFRIVRGDTLRSPGLRDPDGRISQFDVVVANPPFSLANWGADTWAADPRSFCGVPPAKNGDYAWIQHMVASMKKGTGRVGVVMPHGVLFRGSSEAKIRQHLIENDLLDAVIGLAPNLFYGTTIPASLLILRDKRADTRKGHVLFIDGSKRFTKGRNQNELSDTDVKDVYETYATSDVGERADIAARLVPRDEIEGNNWDLNIGRYLKTAAADVVDVASALEALSAARATLAAAEQAMLERLKGAGYA
jgi:type I restriction enzyme M protein